MGYRCGGPAGPAGRTRPLLTVAGCGGASFVLQRVACSGRRAQFPLQPQQRTVGRFRAFRIRGWPPTASTRPSHGRRTREVVGFAPPGGARLGDGRLAQRHEVVVRAEHLDDVVPQAGQRRQPAPALARPRHRVTDRLRRDAERARHVALARPFAGRLGVPEPQEGREHVRVVLRLGRAPGGQQLAPQLVHADARSAVRNGGRVSGGGRLRPLRRFRETAGPAPSAPAASGCRRRACGSRGPAGTAAGPPPCARPSARRRSGRAR